jgi:hypothetical protein
MPGDAQFSVAYPSISSTDSWITAINVNTTLPGIIPIKIYADAAFVNDRISEVNGNTGALSTSYDPQLYYTAGSGWYCSMS